MQRSRPFRCEGQVHTLQGILQPGVPTWSHDERWIVICYVFSHNTFPWPYIYPHPYTLYLDRYASFPRGPLWVCNLMQGNITTKISRTPQIWFRPIPLILIIDKDLTYHGKILSARYEEGWLRAIHATMCISEHRGRPRVRPNLIMPDWR